MNETRQINLTPKAKHFYKELCKERRKGAAVRRLYTSVRCRFQHARKVSGTKTFKKLSTDMGLLRTQFFKSQIRNANRKSKGQRFTLQDKLLALTLQKRCGSGYKLLSSIFALPSKRTLSRVLQSIHVRPGLNKAVLDVLKQEAEKFENPLDKFCFMTFDEMSIAPHLSWNSTEDVIEGFENFGDRTTNKIANHAQVNIKQNALNCTYAFLSIILEVLYCQMSEKL